MKGKRWMLIDFIFLPNIFLPSSNRYSDKLAVLMSRRVLAHVHSFGFAYTCIDFVQLLKS